MSTLLHYHCYDPCFSVIFYFVFLYLYYFVLLSSTSHICIIIIIIHSLPVSSSALMFSSDVSVFMF